MSLFSVTAFADTAYIQNSVTENGLPVPIQLTYDSCSIENSCGDNKHMEVIPAGRYIAVPGWGARIYSASTVDGKLKNNWYVSHSYFPTTGDCAPGTADKQSTANITNVGKVPILNCQME